MVMGNFEEDRLPAVGIGRIEFEAVDDLANFQARRQLVVGNRAKLEVPIEISGV